MRQKLIGDGDSFTLDTTERLGGEQADIERVIRRAEYLAPRDRELVLSVYELGRSSGAVAALITMRPRCVRRRIRSLVARLQSELFIFVLRSQRAWPPSRRRIAACIILQGRTIKQTARQTRMSIYAVRKQRDTIMALFSVAQVQHPAAA